jgi:hypothetical protein
VIELILRNDFATVKLAIDDSPERPRVKITHADGGSEITLDLLELEALTRLGHADFAPIITGSWPPTGNGR